MAIRMIVTVFTPAIAVSACAQAADSAPPLRKKRRWSQMMRLTFHLSYIARASTIEYVRGEYQL
jgi:hypothetical protein